MAAYYFFQALPWLFVLGLLSVVINALIQEYRKHIRKRRHQPDKQVGDIILHKNDRNKSREIIEAEITHILYVCKSADYVKPFYIEKEQLDGR